MVPGARPARVVGTARPSGTIPLGRIRGVPVGAHWSVLGIVALIAVVMARTELPLLAPAHSALAHGVAGTCVALLLMASLLAHEAAHALVAQAAGLEVESVTLWLLGGTTRMRGDPERPAVELRVAVVGPLVSAALAGLFALGTVLARTTGDDLVVAVLAELALINLLLAVFNLLPAAPLDGGRVLRAVLWAARGDRWGAAVAAARTGRVLGALLVAGGFVLAVGVNLGGLWLVLVGWFVAAAAGEEERWARQCRALDGVTVRDAAAPGPAVLCDGAPAELVTAATSPPAAVGGLLLTAPDGTPSGYVPSERLGLVAAAVRDGRGLERLVVPASRLTPVRPDDALAPVLRHLMERDARLVVADADGTPRGTVSRAEVAELLGTVGAASGPPPPGPHVPGPGAPPPADWWWPGGPARSGEGDRHAS